MMINDMKKNELNEQEMANVAGGSYPYDWHRRGGNLPFKALYEAEKQAAAQEAARKQKNQSTVYAHGGVSGSW